MPAGELYINGKDAYVNWGISMDSSSLSALMTPPPMKGFIENKSRLEDGKNVIVTNPKVDERSLTLSFHLSAKSESLFFERYLSFCDELKSGVLDIKTRYQPYVVYHTLYLSCSQFSEYRRGLAKFTLKLNEPNPSNRTQ